MKTKHRTDVRDLPGGVREIPRITGGRTAWRELPPCVRVPHPGNAASPRSENRFVVVRAGRTKHERVLSVDPGEQGRVQALEHHADDDRQVPPVPGVRGGYAARDNLIITHLHLVRKIARKVRRSTQGMGARLEDLEADGKEGLVEAATFAICRSSSAIFLSRGSTGAAFGPRFFAAAPGASSPRSRACRQVVRWDENNPLASKQRPISRTLTGLGLLHDLAFVLDGKRPSRPAFSGTSVTSPRDDIAVAVMMGSSLALLTKLSESSCLTHVGREGRAACRSSTPVAARGIRSLAGSAAVTLIRSVPRPRALPIRPSEDAVLSIALSALA